MLSRSFGFLKQSRTQLYLIMVAVVLFFLLCTQTSGSVRLPLPGRLTQTSAAARARVTEGASDTEDTTGGDHSYSVDSPNKSSSSSAYAKPLHSSSNQTTVSSSKAQHSLPASNAAPDADLLSKTRSSNQLEGAPTKQSSAVFDRDSLGKRHHAQAGKSAAQQPMISTGSANAGSVHSITIKSAPQLDAAAPHGASIADRDDLLIVMPSSIDRMPIVQASRGWRQGVQTYIAFEQEIDLTVAPTVFKDGATKYNEVYGVCPDQVVSDAKWHKAGDLRATVAPFLANMTIGPDNFKWMLFGDDDTVFLIDNVLHLLPHLDPSVPYFMTDHLWYPQAPGPGAKELYVHANRAAPRCLPCNYSDPAESSFGNPSYQYIAPRGCPCNTTTLCEADKLGNFGQDCYWKTNHPGYWYFGHGGAGMLMSSALFRQGSYDDVVNWIWSLGDISSGDSMLMGALHNVMGIIPTDPGYGYFRPTIRLFDPGWHGLQVKGAEDENTGDNGNDPLGVLARLESALQGECSDECEDQLQHTISVHLRTRYLASELDQDEAATHVQNYEGSLDHKPAVYLHHKIETLWKQYNQARSRRSWFEVEMPDVT